MVIVKSHRKIIFTLFLVGFTLILSGGTQVFAQRYSHDNTLGGIENVKFEAKRNGGVIEFNWNIQSTRDITTVEVRRGVIDKKKEIKWETLKEFDASESNYVDYDPYTGKLYYKLVLIGKDGTAREYEPTYLVKGKS